MQALLLTRSVEEGRSLLTENKSLAAELEAMSQDEVNILHLSNFFNITSLHDHTDVLHLKLCFKLKKKTLNT